MKKKVAFLINSLTPGGAERVVSVILKYLRSARYDVELILLEDDIVFDIPDHIPVTRLTAHKSEGGALRKTLQLPLLAMKLARTVRRRRIDLVVSFLYRSDFTNILARFLSGHKVVVSARVNAGSTYADGGPAARINTFLIRRLYPLADEIVNVSEGTKHDLVKNFGIPAAKQSVIYNPYEIETIRSASAEEIALQTDPEKTLIVTAWLRRIKHVDMIIRVFGELRSDLNLVIVGSGEEEARLRRLAAQSPAAGRIHFTGADKNPYKYLSRAAIYLSASASEGFPNAMVEAMLCGCPAVVTDCPSGPREIAAPDADPHSHIEEGVFCADYGVLYPVGRADMLREAIETLLESPEKLAFYRQAGRERAETFAAEQIVAHYDRMLLRHLTGERDG